MINSVYKSNNDVATFYAILHLNYGIISLQLLIKNLKIEKLPEMDILMDCGMKHQVKIFKI